MLQLYGKTHAQGAWRGFGIGPVMLRCGILPSGYPERTTAMKNLFKSFAPFRNLPSIAEIERDYLNASVSVIDLERRQREVDRGLFRRSSFDV